MNLSLYFMLMGQDVVCKYDDLIPSFTLFTAGMTLCFLPVSSTHSDDPAQRTLHAECRWHFGVQSFCWRYSINHWNLILRFPLYIYVYMREKLFMLWLHQTEAPNGPSPESFRCFRHIHMVKSQQKTFMSWDKTRNQNCWYCKRAKAPI